MPFSRAQYSGYRNGVAGYDTLAGGSSTATPSMASAPASVAASGTSSLAGEPLAVRSTSSISHNADLAPFSFRFSTNIEKSLKPPEKSSEDDLSFLLLLSARSTTGPSATLNPQPTARQSTEPDVKTISAKVSSFPHPSSIYSATSESSGAAPAARIWPCAPCGLLLAGCHTADAVALICFDAATNRITQAALPVSVALAAFVAALFACMAARRLDRIAQALLFGVAVVCCALCALMFVGSARRVNSQPQPQPSAAAAAAGQLPLNFYIFNIVLMCLSLIEFVISVITIIVCFRSLRHAYGVIRASSPYSTLIVGDYAKLIVTPPLRSEKQPKNVLLL